ncbi:hypothetical protein ACIRBX_12395 [Kitasatospora sp. NPDC096147]|uniref:hypothetical protein n=1 Tax=Kitasatospora sp. NPDC096147 TaxID=3364093 RepID=UPI00382076BB
MTPTARNPLADGYASLVAALDTALDLGAGLQEIRIHAQHADLVGRLDTLVDIEAGLAAIVGPPGTEPHSAPLPQQTDGPATPALTAARQLELRQDPLVRSGQLAEQALRLLLTLRPVQLVLLQLEESQRTPPDVHGVLVMRGRLGRAAESALLADPDTGREVAERLRRALRLTDVLMRQAPLPPLNRLHRLSLFLTQEVVTAMDRALHRTIRALLLAGPATIAANMATPLTGYLALGREPVSVRYPVLLETLRVTQLWVRTLDAALGELLGTVDHQGLCSALLGGLLDDVTRADLTDVSLTEEELTGLHWSLEHTLWPRTVDVGALLGRSAELTPGVYTVLPPGLLANDWVLA